MSETYDYDLVTIGAGSGGVRATRMAGGLGKKVAIVEESRVGGTCVMRGCVPKKLLVYASNFSDAFEDSVGFGWSPGEVGFDWSKLIAAKRNELNRLERVYNHILKENNVELINGRGVVVDPHTVRIGDKTVTAERILIAVGGWPSLPEIPGIEHAITSNEALDLEDLPKRIVIVGGGYIAVEFAGIFKGLGCEVTEIIRGGHILRGFDEDIVETLTEEMERRGVKILRETTVRSISKEADGTLCLRIAGGNVTGGEIIEADLVMYATGRTPNTKGLGLEEAGVILNDRGAIEVNEYYQTATPSIYALGDVTDRVQLTPVAIKEGMALVQTLFHDNPTTVDYEDIPTAVFSNPNVGTVGLTEAQAREAAEEGVDVYLSRFRPMKGTLSGRDEKTMMKLIVDRKTDRVMGVHMVGPESGEIVQGMGIALKANATKAMFDATVGIHPTAAEEFVTMRDPLPPPSDDCEE